MDKAVGQIDGNFIGQAAPGLHGGIVLPRHLVHLLHPEAQMDEYTQPALRRQGSRADGIGVATAVVGHERHFQLVHLPRPLIPVFGLYVTVKTQLAARLRPFLFLRHKVTP